MYLRKSEYRKRGLGLLNTLINKLPAELHIPGYRYCGPGTHLERRLLRGDPGINKLDEACKQHDIAYSLNKNLEDRHKADKILAEQASQRLKSSNASIGEKIASLGVKSAMKAKVKLGMGCKRFKCKTRKRKTGGVLSYHDVVRLVRSAIRKNKPEDIKKASQIAYNSIKRINMKKMKTPRLIQLPKSGGFLPLIPLFAGLSALGALGGGAAGIAKAVSDTRSASEQLKESQRHNKAMESIAMGKGLYLRRYKQGYGMYLRSPSKSKNFQ